jgi:hypothetical protein
MEQVFWSTGFSLVEKRAWVAPVDSPRLVCDPVSPPGGGANDFVMGIAALYSSRIDKNGLVGILGPLIFSQIGIFLEVTMMIQVSCVDGERAPSS